MNTSRPSRFARLTRAALPAAPLALAAIPSAEAQIAYTAANVTLAHSDNQFIWVDMGTGGSPGVASLGLHNRYASSVASPSFYLWFRYGSGGPEWVSNDGAVSPGAVFDGDSNAVSYAGGNYVKLLSAGTTIDSSLAMGSNYARFHVNNTPGTSTQWSPGTTGYFGVKFNTNTSPLYGWAQLSYNLNETITLIDFAYEASGGAIQAGAGAIPEPSTYAALAGLFAGSVALYRRRQQKKVVA